MLDVKSNKKSYQRPCRSKKKRPPQKSDITEGDTTSTSTSAEKLKKSGDDSFNVHCDKLMSYVIIHFQMLVTFLQENLKCKTCNGDISFSQYGVRGLGFQLCMKCRCGEKYLSSCPKIGAAYEINRRMVFAMRLLGVGIQGIKTFCGIMDLRKGLCNNSYYKIVSIIHIAVSTIFDLCTKKAAKEEQNLNKEKGKKDELTVSGDGSWAKRGFSSLLGIVSLIGHYSGKIIDLVVKSSICKSCETVKKKCSKPDFERWYETHKKHCTANHEGSAGKMEVDGVIEMFKRSIEKFKVKFKNYIGDGDAKTFKNLQESAPYGKECVVTKKECVLHVKKRMFRRAKQVKKQITQKNKTKKQLEAALTLQKGEKTKKSSAKKRASKKNVAASIEPPVKTLTNKEMLKLSTYYGLAIQRNKNSLEGMRKEILAGFYHQSSTDKNPQHSYCPTGKDS